jgi:hypothetical protein
MGYVRVRVQAAGGWVMGSLREEQTCNLTASRYKQLVRVAVPEYAARVDKDNNNSALHCVVKV